MTLYCLLTNGVPGVVRDFGSNIPPVLSPIKQMEWVPYTLQDNPEYDPETHKLSSPVKSVNNGTVTEARSTVILSPQELTNRKVNWFAEDDIKNMPRMIEDLMAAIATGTPLTRDSFPAPVWNKINARRNKRGQAPV